MTHFDERSGVVPCATSWGSWWQTCEEIFISAKVTKGTQSKEIQCTVTPRHIKVVVRGETMIEGDFPEPVHADDVIWTLEDRSVLQICLPKSLATAEHCWASLLVGQYVADPFTRDQMQKKLTLQRFQQENPGFDFSGAELSGNYQGGGPDLSGSS